MKTAKEINDVIQDPELSVQEREEFIKTLTEEEMRTIFVKMCSIWPSSK